MESGADRAQRQVHLGREYEHDERGDEVEAALHQPQPHRDGHECDRQGGEQFEHQRGEERNPQRPHRGPAVVLGERPQPVGLAPGPPERHQHVEPGDEVEEVVAEHGERAPLPARGPLGVQPDEDHEDRDQGHRERDDQPGHPVGCEDPHGHDGRHHGGDQQRREVAAEVALHPVEAAGGQRGQLPGGWQVAVAGAQAQHVLDELRAQLPDDVGRRTVGRHLAGPGEGRAAGDHHGEPDQQRRQVGEAGAAEERACDAAGDQLGLHQHQARGRHRDGRGEHDERARGRRVAQQPGIERPHADGARAGRPVDAGMSRAPMRRRNTQNVHAW